MGFDTLTQEEGGVDSPVSRLTASLWRQRMRAPSLPACDVVMGLCLLYRSYCFEVVRNAVCFLCRGGAGGGGWCSGRATPSEGEGSALDPEDLLQRLTEAWETAPPARGTATPQRQPRVEEASRVQRGLLSLLEEEESLRNARSRRDSALSRLNQVDPLRLTSGPCAARSLGNRLYLPPPLAGERSARQGVQSCRRQASVEGVFIRFPKEQSVASCVGEQLWHAGGSCTAVQQYGNLCAHKWSRLREHGDGGCGGVGMVGVGGGKEEKTLGKRISRGPIAVVP